jgi:xylulokinase
MFWDHAEGKVSSKLMEYYGLNHSMLATQVPVFSLQGKISAKAASETGLSQNTGIAYRAGDQPNNAFSLNVLHAGETAATAGTSGVIYSVTNKNAMDLQSRVNTFLHVNNTAGEKRNGVLLCVNGTGSMNSWLRKTLKVNDSTLSYDQMNNLAAQVPIGSEGVMVMPFGNGAERIFENKDLGASFQGMNFNTHTQAHLLRAGQEGIVFALRYGFDILQEMGLKTTVIRAGNANMFLSPLFREAFVNTIGAPVELYNTDGAKGAALGAGIGAGIYKSFEEAFRGLKVIRSESPDAKKLEQYQQAYGKWKLELTKHLGKI